MSEASPHIFSHAFCSWSSDHPTKPVVVHVGPYLMGDRNVILSWTVNLPSLKPFWDTLTLPQMQLWRLLTAWKHFHFGERRIYHPEVPASSVPGSAIPRTPPKANCANNGKRGNDAGVCAFPSTKTWMRNFKAESFISDRPLSIN